MSRRKRATRLAAGSLLRAPVADADLTPDLLDTAANWLAEDRDARIGGFGGAPKFPQPMALDFLLRQHVRTGAARPLEIAAVLAPQNGGRRHV